MKSRTIRILSIATAMSVLFSTSAFAEILYEYNINDNGTGITVTDKDGNICPVSDVEVTKGADDRYKVTFKKDTDIETASFEASGAIYSNAENDLETGDITYKRAVRGNAAGLVIFTADTVNAEIGDVTVEHNADTSALAQVVGVVAGGSGTANITGGDVSASIKNTGMMCMGTMIQTSGTYSFGDINADSTGTAIAVFAQCSDGQNIVLNAENLTAETSSSGKLTGTSGLALSGYGDGNTAAVNVTGDITGSDAGILLGANGDTTFTVSCLGTVSGKEGAIAYSMKAADTDIKLNVWRLESESGVLLDSDAQSSATYENDEAELAKVNYILKTNNKNCTIVLSAVDGDLGSTGDAFEEEYKTQNEEKQVIINVKAADGYEVSGLTAGTAADGEEIQAVKNADGTWTIIVPRGGGVDITPVLRAIAQQESKQEWVMDKSGKWQYYKANGALASNEWQLITGTDGTSAWYHFGKDTMMNTGWLTDENDGYTYYLDPVTGKMATGHAVIDGKEYYFNETVNEASGWKKNEAGKWVYDKRSVTPLGALIG